MFTLYSIFCTLFKNKIINNKSFKLYFFYKGAVNILFLCFFAYFIIFFFNSSTAIATTTTKAKVRKINQQTKATRRRRKKIRTKFKAKKEMENKILLE